MDPLSALFGWMAALAMKSVEKRITTGGEKFATRALIRGRVEGCIGKVVDNLAPFFRDEKLSEAQKILLVAECERELIPLVADSSPLLAGSLDGEKIYEQLYAGRQLPQSLRDERLGYHYSLLFPRVAHLICRVPGLVEQWQKEAWAENFRRLDDLADAMGDLTRKVDEVAASPKMLADELLAKVRRALLQRVSFKIDLTGLRGDKPEEATMEQMFVLPELVHHFDDLQHVVNSEGPSLQAFLAPNSRTLIEAGGGAGKSTWTAWLQQRGLTCTEKVVIVLRLRDWANKPLPSKDELIREAAGQHLAEGVTAAEVRRWVKAGSLAFLVDGFDEVKPGLRDQVRDWVMALSDAVDGCPILLTSRPLTTDHLSTFPKAWKAFVIQPFDEDRVRDYVIRWYRHYPGLREDQRSVDLNKLTAEWQRDPALAHLTGNPLMLATLLMVHHLDGSLPRGRSALYRRYIDGMLGLWDDRRKLQAASVEIRREDKRALLTRIALRLHLDGQEQIDEDNLLTLLDRELRTLNLQFKARLVLDALRERTGLLIGPGTYGFVHKSVGEYLLAEALEEGILRDDDGQIIDRARLFLERNNDRWNNILFFWAGLTRVADLAGFLDLVEAESGHADWSLLAGLLYEVSDRLSLTSFRERYCSLLKKAVAVDEDEIHNWVVGAMPFGAWEELHVIDPEVRGPQGSDFISQFDELVSQGKIDWPVCETADSTISNSVWIAFVCSTPDLAQVSQALAHAPTFPSESIPAPLFAIDWFEGAWSAANYDHQWYRERLRLIQEWAPEFGGYGPVSLLSNLVSSLRWRRASLRPSRELDALAHALMSIEISQWENKWLQVTREVQHIPGPGERSDLLLIALGSFNAPRPENASALSPQQLEELKKYVESLITRRDGNLNASAKVVQLPPKT